VEREKAMTKVRGWIMTADPAVRLELKGETAEEIVALAAGGKEGVAVNQGYRESVPGNYVIELKQGDEVLQSMRGGLRDNRHYTVVAWRAGSKWELKVFADDLASPNTSERSLRLLNFAAERDTLIAVNDGAEKKVGKQTVEESKVPRGVMMIMVKVLASDGGPPAQSSVEMDFRSTPSAYVVVGPDYRGRMRPYIIPGGTSPDEVEGESADERL